MPDVPALGPGPAGGGWDPEVRETHVSAVVFLGDRAYKIKKPVDLGFLDFTSVASRKEACEREVALNRRLAPDVYLGVLDLTSPEGEIVDHVVVMRRMPPDRRLSTLIERGAAGEDCIRAVARAIASFHGRAERGEHVSAHASVAALLELWRTNAEQLRPVAHGVVDLRLLDEADDLAQEFLLGRDRLIDDRIAAGAAIDGHGDLLADDIFCLDDGPRILDCIEFDDHLRYGDVVADLAFLAMDLERLGRVDLAETFVDAYRELRNERFPASLLHHHVAYRALVRAKVACHRHDQGEPGAAQAASDLVHLALRHLRRAQVRLVLVGGAPGTGKSTVARAVAEARRWVLLRSDEVRKELAAERTSAASTGWQEGLYSPEITAATYEELLRRAEHLLRCGEGVVLDASWSRAAERIGARATASRTNSRLVELRCDLDAVEAASRITRRAEEGTDVSDATPAIAERMRAAFESWPEAATVDTSPPPPEVVDTVLPLV